MDTAMKHILHQEMEIRYPCVSLCFVFSIVHLALVFSSILLIMFYMLVVDVFPLNILNICVLTNWKILDSGL